MYLLSITFHAPPFLIKEWETYFGKTLLHLVENLMDVEQYLLSEIESDLIEEGKNYNLLLFFSQEEVRLQFLEIEFENIKEIIAKDFGQDVLIFYTFLNNKFRRI